MDQRLQHCAARHDLSVEWGERGAEAGREDVILADTLHQGTFGLTPGEHKQVKSLSARANLPENMTHLELALHSLASATSTAIHQARDSQGFAALQRDTLEAGKVTGEARARIESATGLSVVSPENARTLHQGQQPPLLE